MRGDAFAGISIADIDLLAGPHFEIDVCRAAPIEQGLDFAERKTRVHADVEHPAGVEPIALQPHVHLQTVSNKGTFDVSGRLIYKTVVLNSDFQLTAVDRKNHGPVFSRGTYFVKLSNQTGQAVRKLTIE